MGLKSYTGWKLWQTLPGDPWTIGFGHTEGVHPGMQISQTTADRMLESELYVVYEPGVLHACSVPLNDNEFSALLSFAYNEGVHALNTSTLMKKLNAEDRIGAASEFPNWTKAGGQVLPGLVARRHREAALFLTPMSTPA
jgi:lysozyme